MAEKSTKPYLIRAIHELRAVVPSVNLRVVVNRVRPGSLGSSPSAAVGEALSQYAGVEPAALLPYDLNAVDTAMAHGRSLAESAKSSKLRKSLQQFAATLAKDLAA